MTQQKFITAEALASMLGCSVSHSYKLIKKMNDELKERGYIVMAGRAPAKYVEEKFYM